MNKESRGAIERATQRARKLLEEDLTAQLEGTFDVLRTGVVAEAGGAHLSARQRVQRERIVAAIGHKRAAGMSPAAAVADYVRDAAFTTLNRFAALKMLEARELVQQCVSKGELSSGYREFCGMAAGVALLPESAGYRLYIESLFDELSTEVKVLFDRRDPAAVLWPRRAAFEALLAVLNDAELEGVWAEDETIGWIYQFFNSREERQAMRDPTKGGSQAPRNSRELAVRNQFFTPRYVVQFLTDNTLGRTWLAMMGEATRLLERCEYLVREGTEIRPRAKKDPRDLKVLDPACGSGHFLLYVFELLLTIYEEAWDDPDAAPRAETGCTLRQDYPNRAELLRVVPALVIENNLFGVDIDPRAAQIAALALWMRAQRAWNDVGLHAGERPRVGRTHIVVAEPMPGDAELVEAFGSRLDPPLLGELFRRMVAEMRLAGEMGTLLSIEDALETELRRARKQFVERRDTPGFLPGFEPARDRGELDFSGIDEDRFFQKAELLLLDALHGFAETAAGSAGVRRRLFAGDATQGIALIELLRTRFDAVLMNPPFGEATPAAAPILDRAFPDWTKNILCAFIARAQSLVVDQGYVGVIYDRTANIKSTYEQFRLNRILSPESGIQLGLDLGWGVLDANVEVTAAVIGGAGEAVAIVDVRAAEVDEKPITALAGVETLNGGRKAPGVYVRSRRGLGRLPNAVISADFPEYLVDVLASSNTLEEVGFRAYSGYTFKADQHNRFWWEVPHRHSSPFHMPMFNGAGHEPYTTSFVEAMVSQVPPEELPNSTTTYIRNRHIVGSAGLCFGKRGEFLAVHLLPPGMLFTQEGRPLPVPKLPEALTLLGYLNTPLLRYALNLFCGQHKTSGYVNKLPYTLPQEVDQLQPLVEVAVLARLEVESTVETDRQFVVPTIRGSLEEGWTVARRAYAAAVMRTAESEMAWETALEARFRVPSEDSAVLRAFASRQPEIGLAGPWNADGIKGYVESVISFGVGVVFGRFDIRLLTGERAIPPCSALFQPRPIFSPGMLTGDDGLPVDGRPHGYPVEFPTDGILVDDAGHERDVLGRLQRVFDLLFRDSAGECLHEAAAILNTGAGDLRGWFQQAFFDEHVKRYSKSRRKAPIYWQLATASSRYSLWLYAHRLTRDTFFQVQHDLLGPKLIHEERKLLTLTQEAGPSPSVSQRREIAHQEAFVDELRAMADEVARIAPLWNPNLNDGVLITMAPLWRLVSQNRIWQQELKATWDALSAGKYNWAHLAMHLWPERVIPQCAEDRSLAIAHGLEDVFWVRGADGKWTARRTPTRPVQELIAERTSPAVKAALASLQNSPAPAATSGRGRRAAKSGNGGAR